MKLNEHRLDHTNTITAYGEGFVVIDGKRYSEPLLLLPPSPAIQWVPRHFDTLAFSDFQAVLESGAELIIIGTGPTMRLLAPELHARLHTHGLAVEVMSTPAALRTYALFLAEGRRAALGLFF